MLEVRVYSEESAEYAGSFPVDAYNNTFETVASNKRPINYLTFDGLGINLLDNSLKFYEQTDYMGYILPYISSGEHNNLYLYPIEQTVPLTFDFYTTTVKPQHITIMFKDCVGAYKFTTKWTSSNVTLSTTQEILNHRKNIITLDLPENVVSVELTILSACVPNNFIKVETVFFGTINIFDKFKQHNLIEEICVLSDDLPINQFEASIVNSEPDNITFAKKDPLVIFSNGKYYGHFYITDVQRSAKNIFDIVAQNSITLFENDFSTWETNAYGEIAVPTVLNNLKTFTGVDIEYDLDADNKLIRGYHKDGTCRAALCEVCFGLGKMVDGSRNDKIVLRPVPTQITSVITNKDRRIIGDALFKRSNIISSAVVSYKELYPTDAIESDFSQKTISGKVGDIVTISFDKPTAVITNNGVYFTYSKGFEIIHETLCTCIVRLTATSGNVVYIERPMSDEFQTVIENENAQIENVKKYNTFLTRIYDVYEQRNANIKKYIQSRGKVSAKIRLRNERIGDLIQLETAWDGIITGIITKMNIKLGYEDIADIEVLEWSL